MGRNTNKNWKLFIIQGGFYFFGEEVDAPDGYIKAVNVSMFGGFAGGLGVFGVASGRQGAEVTLDRLGDDGTKSCVWPLSAVIGIVDSINMYEFRGTTIRG